MIYGGGINSLAGLLASFSYLVYPGLMGNMAESPVAAIVPTPFHLLFYLVLWPLTSLLQLFFTAVVWHACLMLLGGTSRSFTVTLKTVCYAMTPCILGVVCGGLLFLLLGIVVGVADK